MRTLLRTAAAMLLVALSAAPITAQTLTGAINGTIRDEQGAVLPGANVTLTGRQGAQTQVTDADGTYRFLALNPGTYEVSAELAGFQTVRQGDLVITAGRNLEIDLTLRVGALAESVTVLGESPVVDTKSSATDTTLSQDLLYSAPITRTAINVLNYAPGINNGSAYGGDADSGNALMIDGVDTRDPSGGTAWTFYNYNIVEEFQFQGLGAQAEYGGFTGAVVNTITKSGGNRFAGLFDVLFTNSGMNGDNVPSDIAAVNPTLADPAVTKKYWDLTTQVSGPIVQNKLFFFGSAQRFQLEVDPTGPVTLRKEISPRLNGKLTWQPNATDNFAGHLQYDAYNIIGRAGQGALLSTDDLTNREDAPEYVWLLQWRHLFGANTFSEVKYTGWWGFYDLNPEVDEPVVYYDTGLITGGQGWFYYADRGRNQVNASLSHYADKFGRHELKFGAEFERSTTRDRYGYTSGVYFYNYAGYLYAYAGGYDITAKNTRQSLFAQDSWRIGENWTINAGIRGDFIKGGGKSGSAVYSSNNWAPRLGFAWDLAGDHRTVVKGSYGWYYEGPQTQLFTSALPGVNDFVSYYVLNNSVTNPELEEFDRVVNLPYQVADDISHPRVDEWTLGFERAITGDMRFSFTGIWRDWANFVGSVNPGARWTPSTTTNSFGQQMTVYRWANRNATENGDNFLIRNVDGFQYLDANGNVLGTASPYREYRAAMFVLSKRFTDRWQAQASYVWSRSKGSIGNGSGAIVATNQWETPNLALINADGRVANDRPHEFKLLGTYQIPKVEVSVSGYFRSVSGGTYAAFERFGTSVINAPTAYRQPFVEQRGIRRLQRRNELDLRFEKNFTMGSNRFGLYLDLFNLANASTATGRQARTPSVDVFVPAEGGSEAVTLPFDTVTGLVSPRRAQIGVRWSF